MFQGNVNGLRIGAPVKFKGVQIGTVEEIKLALSPSEGELRPDLKELRLPVIIGIDRSMITQTRRYRPRSVAARLGGSGGTRHEGAARQPRVS